MNMNKTPLHEWHVGHGAKMVDFEGWDMPVQYEPGILKEHLTTRRYGGLFDVSHMGRFRFKGEDVLPFLQHVLSNNAQALEPGQAQYTLIPNERGGLCDDAYLYRWSHDDYMLVVNASNRPKDLEFLRTQARIVRDLEVVDESDKIGMLAFQGPMAGPMLASLAESGSLPDTLHNSLSEMTLFGVPCLVARTGYTGEPVGFELFVPVEGLVRVWDGIFTKTTAAGVLPIGLGARDTLRLEAGMPLYGHEFGLDPDGGEIPAFAFPLTRIAVSFAASKGFFIGRDALARQFEETRKMTPGRPEVSLLLPRRIRCLAVLDKGVVRRGDPVFLGDRKVGVVTSGTTVPYWKFIGSGTAIKFSNDTERRSIALAYVDSNLYPDTDVEVVVRERRLACRLVKRHGSSEAPPYFRPILATAARAEGTADPDAAAFAVANGLKKAEILVQRTVDNHEWRQRRCVNLIPSEMTASPLVRLLETTDPSGRYAEHRELVAALDSEVFYYQGTDFIAWVEQRLAEELSSYLECPLIEARALSGQMANMIVYGAYLDHRNRGDPRREPQRIQHVLTHHLSRGGHLSAQAMGALRDYVARDPVTELYSISHFPVQRDNPYRIDLTATADLAARIEPEIVVLGKSMVLHPEPVAEIRRLFMHKRPRPLIVYDAAHVLGLIGPHFQRPFKDGANIVTGSTHKTFFGTQRGIIGAAFAERTPEFDLWKAIRRRAFPGMTSNHHLGSMLGLLMAAIEMNAFKDQYQPRVLANAKAFAKALKACGLDVQGDPAVGYTETHQVIVRVGRAEGCQAARELERNNIIVNYQAIPGDESFTASSGIRVGVAEMTRFGMQEGDFSELAGYVSDVLRGRHHVADKVEAFRGRFTTMQYCFDAQLAPAHRKRLEELR